MKKLTAAVAALALFFSASAFGPEPTNDVTALLKNASDAKVVKSEKVGKVITSSFKEQFSKATDVQWKENQGLYFGYFNECGKQTTVAYTYEGELFAVARQVKMDELPEAVSQKLKDKYSDCIIAGNAVSIEMQGENSYYFSVENKNSTKLIKILPEGQDEVLNKTKKKVLVGTVS